MDLEMRNVRRPAVAGTFYPLDRDELASAVTGFLARIEDRGPVPKALIVPHAGYIYSGPIAASAYARLRDANATIRRVVLIGPAHRVAFRGLALSDADVFSTPLGDVPVDKQAVARIIDLPQVIVRDDAHRFEHSLEVHLPFLQDVLGDFTLVPLVAGTATPDEVAEVLDVLWDGDETLIVVSSDLSHYHDYRTAQRLDKATSQAIEGLQVGEIEPENACGCVGINGLLAVARRRGLVGQTIDLRNSGDTAGPRNEVVGYGAYVFA